MQQTSGSSFCGCDDGCDDGGESTVEDVAVVVCLLLLMVCRNFYQSILPRLDGGGCVLRAGEGKAIGR